MNILHVNQSDISGGAAIACDRLHQGLLAQGIDSRLLVGSVESNGDRVAAVAKRSYLESWLTSIARRFGMNYVAIVSTFKISGHPFYQHADLLNFHNLHPGYFNYLAISSLTKNKPAVYTLHDMWSFTGHCAYSYDCERWKIGCGKCPYPNIYPAIQTDNTHLEWKLKNWIYSYSNLSVVAPSRWLTQQAKHSMLNRFPIHYIPNGIDTQAYQPLDRQQCRSLLGIPPGKKVLMIGATSLTARRKGGALLLEALASLPSSLKMKMVLLLLGRGGKAIASAAGIAALDLGYVSSDRLKSIAYSATDLFIYPTRADNLPLMLQESMACGTPIVSFKVGGVPELVRPDVSGYLAQPEDSYDLCNGIMQLLEDEFLWKKMSQNCRQIALTEYSLELQTQRYIELYSQILPNRRAIAPQDN
ncbi:glycosyltransferase family 4 protein [Pleurocapsales cyanobacterium LEGE 10410]|nr:glycosyltransferase family 4 protein [Pleurocapsales cyanobacterium LEGE 10410]